MTSKVKAPNPFGGDYEDPLETLKAAQKEKEKQKIEDISLEPTTPTTPSPSVGAIPNVDRAVTDSTAPTTPSPTTPTTPTTPSKRLGPTSPVRDFQKVSNSITREAIPSGLFGSGKAKQLYDALYFLTRGAIRPVRTIRITKPRLMKLAGIGTRQTLWLNLEHLESAGLVRKNVLLGEHGGNEYEVFVPEEIPKTNLSTTPTTPTTPTSPSDMVYRDQNLEGVVGIDSNPAVPSVQSINTATSDTLKTVFKDPIKPDDETRVTEAFAILANRLDTAAKKITGKGVSRAEAEKWGTLADLLILELEIAASRADGVSSIPAFLTEVLRRQFFSSRQKTSGKPSKAKVDDIGKSESGTYEIKPLDEKGRELALEQLREFAEDVFLQDFKKWYTEKDWKWLTENLK